jgi:outer membrane protein OmpA-like peptidoglycan-associated protein
MPISEISQHFDGGENRDILDFNFWPSFADLMLSVVLILTVILFFFARSINKGNWNLQETDKSMVDLVNAIAKAYKTKPEEIKSRDQTNSQKKEYGISTIKGNPHDIFIFNGPGIQRLTFGENILFKENEYILEAPGKKLLDIFAENIKPKLNKEDIGIKEIQIQGHADPRPTDKYKSNLELAAFRAIEVFNYLKDECAIDPSANLMSATSFGEFKPIQRKDDDFSYDNKKLGNDNDSLAKMEKNRRIEILLFYRY